MLVNLDWSEPPPPKRYGAFLIDPPWKFDTWSEAGKDRSAERHYPTLDFGQLLTLPVLQLAADNAALFLWATDPLLPRAIQLMEAWGFEYKTVAFYWIKLNKRAKHPADYFTGLGYWTRANPELCLLGTRGKPKRLSSKIKRLIVSPRRQHSRKPDETRNRIQRLVRGPYLEMFARQTAPGWDSWGNETTKFNAEVYVPDLFEQQEIYSNETT